jgi:hypothetical protein
VKEMYENGMDCLTQSPGFEWCVSIYLKQTEESRRTSMGFRKVRLTCMGPTCEVTTVCVGVITISVRFAVPLTTDDRASPRTE